MKGGVYRMLTNYCSTDCVNAVLTDRTTDWLEYCTSEVDNDWRTDVMQ